MNVIIRNADKIGTFILLFLILNFIQMQIMKNFNSGTPIFENKSTVIPFDLRGHKIYVKARINDVEKDYNFILDTGSLTAIDERTAKELNLEIGIELPMPQEGQKAYLTKKGLTISLGGLKVKDFMAIVSDLPEASHNDPSIDGFIGSDFLRFFQITIDYKKKKIILSHSDYPLDNMAGAYEIDIHTPFPFRFPLVKCKIDEDIEVQAMLDTGAPFSVVGPLSLIDKQRFSESDKPIKSKGLIAKWPFTSADYNYLARVKILKIGTLELQNIPIIYAELPKNLSYLLFGKDLLFNFLVTINYPKNKLFMLPYKEAKFKSNLYSIGLAVRRDESGKTIVQGYWEGSPADRCGIQLNDEVLEINTRKTKDLSLREINEILDDDQIDTIDLLIKGTQGEKRLTLKKAMLLPEINIP